MNEGQTLTNTYGKEAFLNKTNLFLNCMFGYVAAAAPMVMLRILGPLNNTRKTAQAEHAG